MKNFIKADVNHNGFITIQELVLQYKENKTNLPYNILNFFLNTLIDDNNHEE